MGDFLQRCRIFQFLEISSIQIEFLEIRQSTQDFPQSETVTNLGWKMLRQSAVQKIVQKWRSKRNYDDLESRNILSLKQVKFNNKLYI